MIDRLALWVATVGPIGRIKYAPGTFGSLAAIPLILLTQNHLPFSLVLFVFFLILGIWSSDRAAQNLKLHDPSVVVIDEVCGMLMTFLFVPITWASLLIGFGLFRLFDVLKPPPIRLLEKTPGGVGIVLDDLGAGLFASLILHLVLLYV